MQKFPIGAGIPDDRDKQDRFIGKKTLLSFAYLSTSIPCFQRLRHHFSSHFTLKLRYTFIFPRGLKPQENPTIRRTPPLAEKMKSKSVNN